MRCVAPVGSSLLALLVPLAAGQQPGFVLVSEGLLTDDPPGGATLTANVSVSGEWAAVGHPDFPDPGTVTILQRQAGGWQEHQVLRSPDLDPGFGRALDLAGDRLAVGLGPLVNEVHVYERDAAGYQLSQTLAPNPADGQSIHFGESVAIDGDLCAVADPEFNSGMDQYEGRVYLYARGGGAWVEDAVLTGRVTTGGFASWIDLSRNRLSVFSGSTDWWTWPTTITTYDRGAGGWNASGSLQGHFGFFVHALDGDRMVVATREFLDPTVDVRVYERPGGSWVEVAHLGSVGTSFPALAIDGERVLVGDGSVRVFEPVGGIWTERASTVVPGGGAALSLDGPFVVAGAHADQGRSYALLAGLEWRPFCSGDGSAAACPCGNASAPGSGEGCANSTGLGARLDAAGSTSLAADDLTLFADQLPPDQPALFFAGFDAVAGGTGLAFGDGLRCVLGGELRLATLTADGSGAAALGPGVAGLAGWEPGSLRRAQVWYRDPLAGPCGSGFNLANALELIIAP